MPDRVREGLRPSVDFRGLIDATVAAIREQMEERRAERDAPIAGLFAERKELRRLVTGALTTERIVRDEAARLRTRLDNLQARAGSGRGCGTSGERAVCR